MTDLDPISSTPEEIERALGPLREAPEATAILTDLDGTLAEIVERPGDARIDRRGAEALARIGDRYRLAGVITGRRSTDARRIVGLPGLAYVGNHGAERLSPGGEKPEPAPGLEDQLDRVAEFLARLEPGLLDGAGLSVEDKGPIRALHWRAAPDRQAAEATTAAIEAEAEAEGLHTHRGRMVCEIRPPIEIDKGDGLRGLLAGAVGIRQVLYGGDDRTDVDAFRAMEELAAEGSLERAVAVGVISPEGPAEVFEAAAVTVDGVDGYVEMLERLV